MANKVRGEIEIDLNGRKFTLKPEFEGMLAAEDQIGKPLPVCFTSWATRSPSLREVVSVIYGGLLWDKDVKGRTLTFEEVGRRVVEHGHMALIVPVIQLVRSVLIPPTDEPEDKPAKKKSVKGDSLPSQSPGEPGIPS